MARGRKKEIAFLAATLVALIVSAGPELAARLAGLLHESGPATAAAYLAVWLASGCCLWFFLSFAPRSVRVLIAPLFLASAVFIGAYYLAAREPLEALGFERMLDARNYAGDAAEQYRPQLLSAILLNLPLAAVLLFSVLRKDPATHATPAARTAGVLSLCLATAVIAMVCWVRGGRGTAGLPPPLRIIAYSEALFTDQYFGRSAYPHRPVADTPHPGVRHVVYVVDESVVDDVLRKDSDVRIDTPSLPSGIEYDFGPAVSGGDCSSDSNLILRLGPRPLHLSEDLQRDASIWEYAKRAGYETVYIDGQDRSDVLHNWMSVRERGFIDHVYVFPNVPVALRDGAAGKLVAQLTAKDTPQFIYVNKVGPHFPYDSKYPAAAARYLPTAGFAGDASVAFANQQHMLGTMAALSGTVPFRNSYRNAVEWNLNAFFRAWPGLAADTGTVVVYTSDHGQNLWREHGITITHCTSVPRSTTRVPLIVFTANPKWSAILRKASRENFGMTTHFNIFASLLGFMGFQPPYQEPRAPPLWSTDPSPEGLLTVKDGLTFRFGGKAAAMETICPRDERLLPLGSCAPDLRVASAGGR
jgi:hypothetical protein